MFGSRKRLEWVASWLEPDDRVLEVGCGTGVALLGPLLERGVAIRGIDLDPASVAWGRAWLERRGLPPDALARRAAHELEGPFDVVIASEVLEHCRAEELAALLPAIRGLLRPGGRLLVTVPNGRGWFERESWLLRTTPVGRLVDRPRLTRLAWELKARLFGADRDMDRDPTTLASSPHVQSFSLAGLIELLARHGFRAVEATGSTLIAGQLSHLLWSGIGPAMRLNAALGDAFAPWASGFFVAATREGDA